MIGFSGVTSCVSAAAAAAATRSLCGTFFLLYTREKIHTYHTCVYIQQQFIRLIAAVVLAAAVVV